MNIISPLISIHSLQIRHMSDHMILINDAVPSQDIPRLSSNIQRFLSVVSLQHGDHLRGNFACVFQLAESMHSVEGQSNISGHVGKLGLDQLVGG